MKQFKGIRFGNYLLSADDYCFHLSEVAVITNEDSKNFGKEYLRNTTYHSTLEQVANKLTKLQLLKGVQESTSMSELINLMDVQGKELEHNLLRVVHANQE
ncbi:hypothetical protein [Providencia phage PSTRCR_114]|uniref:Uncharacterized protein n=1 Tax=Providencia phage PSTRCR_114 TaxID=2800824 RepID=A0A7T7CL13_9CAUD|nr:hypothetical protein [Providencia phage PSTRCR_114]